MQIDSIGSRWSRVSNPTAAAFVAEGFPTYDAPVLGATLDAAFAGLPIARAGTPARLGALLQRSDIGALILPYGSGFPVEAWEAIRHFLRNGGSLVVLGGAPFHQPVRSRVRADGSLEWTAGTRQPTFAHELLIGPAEPWTPDPHVTCTTRVVPDTGWNEGFPHPATTWSLTVRFASRKDQVDEDGSAGPRDAVLRPLVQVIDPEGVPRGCPLLEIDRLRGDEAGGRWVLSPSDARLTAPIVRAAVSRALEGSSELYAVPVRACVDASKTASLRITRRRASPRAGEIVPRVARVTVTDSEARVVFTDDIALHGPAECRTGIIDVTPASALRPGLYHAQVLVPDAATSPRTTVTGFWVRDQRLLANARPLTVSRDWLRRDGVVVPIVGTTYMASDVHRKFLFEPNPHVWNRDFADMARIGINMVRTGLWTAWRRTMLDPGALDEAVLAALEAYVLTAASHGVTVCFNFFAFLPPAFSGDNPYLDPRAIEGQRELLTLFATRFRGVHWIHWDLINEPSYSPPERLWQTRAIGDRHERRAFAEWVRVRHGDDSITAADRWRDTSTAADAVAASPRHDEFGHHVIREGRRPRKVRDFREFTQDVVASWAALLRAVLRSAGGEPLVTLGQDEGGTGDRPAQQTLADALDYTAVHTWWNNDDLLWDGVVTKVPEKPNLHQETGLMRLEDMDGYPWRTPEAAASLLERKVAYAFAARGAGVIEWAWNINPYQPIDNESVIGLYRPDGTAKPERQALVDAAEFFRTAAAHLDDFQPDPVVMVVPHARLFLGRPGGLEATKIVVRALAERFGVVPTALSDLRLTADRLRGARLVLVPCAEVLDEPAARALLEAVEGGSCVLVTGAVEGDSYGRPVPSLQALNLLGPTRPLAFHEESRWSSTGWISFEGLLVENVRRSLKRGLEGFDGRVWHEPLPIELARDREPLVRLLGAALEAARVETHPSDVPVAARVLLAPEAALVVCVNETASDVARRVKVDGHAFDVPVRANGARMAVVDRRGVRVVCATPGPPILTLEP